MSRTVTVDLGDATPPYEQIRRQLASMIALGELSDGARLPTVRALAADLGVAPGTVNRAYKELESAGMIASRRRLGTVVTAARHPAAPGTELPSGVERALELLVEHARNAGLDDESVLELLRGRLRDGGRTPRLGDASDAPSP
ncbi:GntR family transcriptional regulator [Zafaria sp. J156]|uniref:GntR family transcriptional regulator n=1 Tax=Zafaria sp. J156 TaxID=3116490 RepID=UPI002E75A959|nr:GntR family transcriptional regulator [Zafaria sp. J156]MEE1620603.1 GntR family transcriptional regulator [Zafaria sp. J156]